MCDEKSLSEQSWQLQQGYPTTPTAHHQLAAFQSMINALNSGNPNDFDAITMA
jgi:hypothetical protein